MTSNNEVAKRGTESMKILVAELISSHCHDLSEFQDFRRIGQALQAGAELQLDILSGGYTNYSYRIFLDGSPSVQLFAKLSFSHALWNPDPTMHYDLSRTDNEYKMMKLFHKINPEAVAVPYLLLDVEDMKLLVTQWSEADEQWANQFIDGSVDTRIIPIFARDLAKLHVMDVEPEFNVNVKDYLLSAFSNPIQATNELLNQETMKDRVAELVQGLGKEAIHLIFENCMKDYRTPKGLIHNDTHVFNILVEKKPDMDSFEDFGEKGKYTLCDWEMAISGPLGHDVGLFFSFPIACVLAHGFNGHKDVANTILDILDHFWVEYSLALKEEGKYNEEYMYETFRSSVGWAGYFLYVVLYHANVMVEHLPLSQTGLTHVRESIGYVGFQFMNIAFGNFIVDTSLDSLRSLFRTTIEIEVAQVVPINPLHIRRPSTFRTSGRRFSDASSVYASLNSSVNISLADLLSKVDSY